MIDRALKKVILIDGDMAGTIIDAPPGGTVVYVPKPYKIPLVSTAHLLPRDAGPIAYRIHRADYFLRGEIPIPFLAGVTGTGQPDMAALSEHVPAALAALDVIPWTCVPDTPLDESNPVALTHPGDPLTPCAPYVDDYFGREIAGRCTCGWETTPVAPERRSQITRAYFRHKAEIERRRHSEDLPIRILEPGHPAFACSPMMRQDDRRWMDGVCNCGWRTQQVPEFLAARIMELCGHHLDDAVEAWSSASSRDGLVSRPEYDGFLASLDRTVYPSPTRAEYNAGVGQLDWGDPLTDADANWPDDASRVCAHLCGGDHECDVRATARLAYKLPSGGTRSMPICGACHQAETAAKEAADA